MSWIHEIMTEYEAWEVAFDAGVKWTLQQDANTLNKLQLTQEKSDEMFS